MRGTAKSVWSMPDDGALRYSFSLFRRRAISDMFRRGPNSFRSQADAFYDGKLARMVLRDTWFDITHPVRWWAMRRP